MPVDVLKLGRVFRHHRVTYWMQCWHMAFGVIDGGTFLVLPSIVQELCLWCHCSGWLGLAELNKQSVNLLHLLCADRVITSSSLALYIVRTVSNRSAMG